MNSTEHSHGRMGHEGTCICVGCGHRQPHQPGQPCKEERCPKCGKALLREGSPHHLAYLERKAKRGAAATPDA